MTWPAEVDVARRTTAWMRRDTEATWQGRGWPMRGAGGADTWQEATWQGRGWPMRGAGGADTWQEATWVHADAREGRHVAEWGSTVGGTTG